MGQAIFSDIDATDKEVHFGSDDVTISWLFNTQDNYYFDVWPESHKYMVAVDNMSSGKAYGQQLPQFLTKDPLSRYRIGMEPYSLVIFWGQLLHRGTRNLLQMLHMRFLGEIDVLEIGTQMNHSLAKISVKDVETFFLKDNVNWILSHW